MSTVSFKKIKFNLRLKLILMTLFLALVPLILVMVVIVGFLKNTELHSSTELSKKTALAATEDISSFIVIQFDTLKHLSSLYPEISLNKETLDKVVERVLFQSEDFIEVTVVNAEGKEVVRKHRVKVIGQNELVDRWGSAEFQQVKNNSRYFGPLVITDGKPLFTIGEPINTLNGAFDGAIFAQIDARMLQDIVTSISATHRGRSYIVDKNGMVVAHPDISMVLGERNLSSIPIVQAISQKEIISEPLKIYKNELNEQVVGVVTPITATFRQIPLQTLDTGWFIVAEQPASVALANVYRLANFSYLVLIFVLILVSIITLLAAQKIVEPIEQVYAASKQLGEGNLNIRVNVHTNDEIEDLGHEFNQMAVSLQRNIEQLNQHNKLLVSLRNLDKSILATLEVKALCQAIVNSISDFLGYMFGAVALITPDGQGIRRTTISQIQDEQLKRAIELTKTPFSEQIVSLNVSDNLLVRAVKERKSFVTSSLRDIQVGLFTPDVSDKIQELLNIKRIFIYPLVTKDRVLGIIYFASTIDKEVTQMELNILQEFASEVARALDNAFLYQNIKQDKTALSAERNKLSVVISGVTDAVIAVDSLMTIILFNKAAENLTGYKSEQVLNKKIGEVIKVYDQGEELTPLDYCPIKLDAFEGIVFKKEGLKIKGAGDKEIYVKMTAGQIKEAAEINLGCIITFHDMTEERQLEEMKLDFVSMAVHELRTPLTSIKGYLYVYMKNFMNTFTTEQLLYLTRTNIAVQRLSALIENLLNVSRIERGSLTVNLEKVDWIENIKEVMSELTVQVQDKGLDMMFKTSGESKIQVMADKFRINEVLSNLLSNAISYTPSGGKIEVWVEQKDSYIITHIKDTGEGIPETALPHLFTKFFRVSGRLEQGSKGTGLGLYIAKSIVELHRGKIWVESKVGEGSTFSFSLPSTAPKSDRITNGSFNEGMFNGRPN